MEGSSRMTLGSCCKLATQLGCSVCSMHRQKPSTHFLCFSRTPSKFLNFHYACKKHTFRVSVNNQVLFWSIFSDWMSEDRRNAANVPFSAMALPLSMIVKYLLSDEIEVFKIIDSWMGSDSTGNIHARCALIAVLYFRNSTKTVLVDVDDGKESKWKRYVEYALTLGSKTKASEVIAKHADKSVLPPVTVTESEFDEELTDGELEAISKLLEQYYCGSVQDLCNVIVCLGETEILDFINLLEKEQPNDDAIWNLLVAEFRRLEDDLEHRLDITYRLQDLAESLAEQFNTNVYLKLLANTSNANLNLTCLNVSKVQFLFDQVTPDCSEVWFTVVIQSQSIVLERLCLAWNPQSSWPSSNASTHIRR